MSDEFSRPAQPRARRAVAAENRHKSEHLERVWSVAIYRGASPLTLSPFQPGSVITTDDVTDVDAELVADPFMLCIDGTWHLYFEILIKDARRGVIGRATSANGIDWTYAGVVLRERFHLSYPMVFEANGSIYLMPESAQDRSVRLYRADHPEGPFEAVATLLKGSWVDSTLFRHEQKWWLFTCPTPVRNDTLELFIADKLHGPYHRHPVSPIVRADPRIARPAGRIHLFGGRPIRYAQDCSRRYGESVRALTILTLSSTDYREVECPTSPVLRPAGRGWNSTGMHHLDAHPLRDGSWLACVDGDHR